VEITIDIIDEVKEMLQINSALEIQNIEQSENAMRFRRSLDFIGDFSSWCCGIATVKNLDDLYTTEDKLKKFTTNMESKLMQENQDLIKITKIMNSYGASLNSTMSSFESHWGDEFSKVMANENKLQEAGHNKYCKKLA